MLLNCSVTLHHITKTHLFKTQLLYVNWLFFCALSVSVKVCELLEHAIIQPDDEWSLDRIVWTFCFIIIL